MHPSILENPAAETEREIRPDEPPEIGDRQLARQDLVLCALIRQALPMLTYPYSYRSQQRRQLAQTLRKALAGCLPAASEEPPFTFDDADTPPEEEAGDDYEPGCLLEGSSL